MYMRWPNQSYSSSYNLQYLFGLVYIEKHRTYQSRLVIKAENEILPVLHRIKGVNVM